MQMWWMPLGYTKCVRRDYQHDMQVVDNANQE